MDEKLDVFKEFPQFMFSLDANWAETGWHSDDVLGYVTAAFLIPSYSGRLTYGGGIFTVWDPAMSDLFIPFWNTIAKINPL